MYGYRYWKLAGRKGSQHWRRERSGVSIVLTVRWSFVLYQREEEGGSL